MIGQQITDETAHHVLFVFDSPEGHYPPGNFVSKLLEAMAVADLPNLLMLGRAFPAYAKLVHMYKFEENGADQIKRIANGESFDD